MYRCSFHRTFIKVSAAKIRTFHEIAREMPKNMIITVIRFYKRDRKAESILSDVSADTYVFLRESLRLIDDGLRPKGNLIGVALKRFAIGHAEQQASLSIIHGVIVDVHTVGNGRNTLAVEYRLLIARDNFGNRHITMSTGRCAV